MNHAPIPPEDEDLAHRIIGAAIEVHRVLGPGFLEKIYERALCHELMLHGIECQPQQEILVPYKDIRILGQQLDLLVGSRVIVELKAVTELHPLHHAQLLSYLRRPISALACSSTSTSRPKGRPQTRCTVTKTSETNHQEHKKAICEPARVPLLRVLCVLRG